MGTRVDNVGRGKDIDLLVNVLAVITTVIIVLIFHWRHCFDFPALSTRMGSGMIKAEVGIDGRGGDSEIRVGVSKMCDSRFQVDEKVDVG